MDDKTRKVLDRLESEFQQHASVSTWDTKCIEVMKNLQKLMYYIEVREAMKNGGNGEYDEGESSYRRGGQRRSGMGQSSGHAPYTYYSGAGYMNGWDSRQSGRRYYDDGPEDAYMKLQEMHDMETNPEVKDAIMHVMRELGKK